MFELKINPCWNKQLDPRAFLVFQRLHRFYTTFVVLGALISALALAALTFDEFHPTTSNLARTSEGFLCSSAITSVISAVVAIILLFQFEGIEKATRRDMAIAWSPLVFLDLSIIEFLIGLVCWYSDKNSHWRAALMETQLAGLLGLCFVLSSWVWFFMQRKGGLGKDEVQASLTQERACC